MAETDTDLLTPELRSIEAEVDSHYKANPLIGEKFAAAAWYLLAFGEYTVTKAILVDGVRSTHDDAMLADNLVNDLKYPMCWLYSSCLPDGEVPFHYNDGAYDAALDLLTLGQQYRAFVAAFSLASCGLVELELRGSTIYPGNSTFTDLEYEAYNRLLKPSLHQIVIPGSIPADLIERSLRIDGDRFAYKLTPRLISQTVEALKPQFNQKYVLPEDWQFSEYSLGDFRKVFDSIAAIAFIHLVARILAAGQGCPVLGYADSIYVPTHDELLRRTVRYSGLPEAKVLSIFDDLSYGNRGISNPDPALQPLVRLKPGTYAIMPSLWISSAAERNLTVPLNRLPDEKRVYSRLVSLKESLMRSRMQSSLLSRSFRLLHGKIPASRNLPDIDLALIDDSERACLLLELKWFIEPAEPREIAEKSQELSKGISQMLQLKRALMQNNESLFDKLGIDASYDIGLAVVSANWIGHADIQNLDVAVIQQDHITEKLRTTTRLREVIAWLSRREYLPRRGEHFDVREVMAEVGKWNLKWYGIEPLTGSAFFPR